MDKKRLIAITGASSGIGKAAAFLFSKMGYPVLLMARRKEIMDSYDIKEKISVKVDVTDIEQIRSAIKLAEEKYGPVDLMLNNAGIMPLDLYTDQSLADKYATLDVNVKGVINGMDVVLPNMIKRKTGTIINISSIAGRYTSINHAIYNGAKSAVNAITEQARKENAKYNIRFSLIEPGTVDTNLLDLTKNTKILEDYNVGKSKINGGLKADDIAKTILYVYELPQIVSIKEVLITHTNQPL